MKCCEQKSPVHDQAGLDPGPLDQQTSTKPTELLGHLSHGRVARKLTQLSPRSHPRQLVGKRTANKTQSKTSPATAR